MLLGIDLGNTNITIGVFNGKDMVATFRMTTKISRTSDEYGIFICDLLEHRNIQLKEIEDVIIASVVPDMMYSLTSAIIKYFHLKPIIVNEKIKSGIKFITDNPAQIGADRIADAAAAYKHYGGPVIVVDFGTATTFDLVLSDGSFKTTIIAPGLQTSAKALSDAAAKLPQIEIKKPDSILAKDTITGMQAGIVFGYIGQTEYIINQLKKESALNEAKVVATGGLGAMIAKETASIDVYNKNLTLQGLQLIYEYNK